MNKIQRTGVAYAPMLIWAVVNACALGQSQPEKEAVYWSEERTFRFSERTPEKSTMPQLVDLRIQWSDVEIDTFGDYITITGILQRRSKAPSHLKPVEWEPIDWSQGISVMLEKSPSESADYSTKVRSDKEWRNTSRLAQSLLSNRHKTCISKELTDAEGRFKATFPLDQISRDSSKAQSHRVVVSFANRVSEDRIKYSSDDPILELSMGSVTIPANKPIEPILASIHQACAPEFNPTAMILTINKLQQLGKDGALRKLKEYIEVINQRDHFGMKDVDGVFWIIRILFEPIDHNHRIPIPKIYANWVTGQAAEGWPLNPIIVIDDIPFRFVGGGIGGTGIPEHPYSHIDFVQRYCVIRDAPLAPKQDPITTAQMLIESQIVQVIEADDRKSCIEDIRKQAMLMVPQSRRPQGDKNKNIGWFEAWERSLERLLKWVEGQGFLEF